MRWYHRLTQLFRLLFHLDLFPQMVCFEPQNELRTKQQSIKGHLCYITAAIIKWTDRKVKIIVFYRNSYFSSLEKDLHLNGKYYF